MPLLHRRSRADMYGLAAHPRHYEGSTGRLARPLYRRIVADVMTGGLPVGATVLDVGTGPGIVPRMLATATAGLHVRGVDLSAEMVSRASEAAAELGLPSERLGYDVADVANLPFDDASVDLVISSLSLHHWSQPAAGLREVARVLKPGAQAWIYDIRPLLRRQGEVPGTERRVDSPLIGTPWFNPIGRLALRRLTGP
jgi:ubiquinone/menaquinone biosynthesis C-methylase UbiE